METPIPTLPEVTYYLASRKRRAAAFLIDHAIISATAVMLCFLVMGTGFIDDGNADKLVSTLAPVMLIAFAVYFCKDVYKGISPGKWIMGIMVRDVANSSQIPTTGRLIIRNLTIPIWPIEAIVSAVNTNKERLGDKLAHAHVVRNPNKANRWLRIVALIATLVVIAGCLFLFIMSVIKNSAAYKTAIEYVEHDKQIIEETGGIKDYGTFPTGQINMTNNSGQAVFNIDVLGNSHDVHVQIYLVKEPGGKWYVLDMRKY